MYVLQDHDVRLGVPGSVVNLLSDLYRSDMSKTARSKAVGSADCHRKSATESTGSHTWPFTHLPIRYILHDLLFSGERSGVPSVGISVLFGEDEGDEVDPRPSRLSLEFSVSGQAT